VARRRVFLAVKRDRDRTARTWHQRNSVIRRWRRTQPGLRRRSYVHVKEVAFGGGNHDSGRNFCAQPDSASNQLIPAHSRLDRAFLCCRLRGVLIL
jgi:hypothetical protein